MKEPFGYMHAQSLIALTFLREYWHLYQDGPLITMDAGPNIHLLFRPDQQQAYQQIANHLGEKFQLFTPHLHD